MANNSDFQWSDAFLLGYGPMDATHREFVTLVQALSTCADAEMLAHLRAFARHAEEHFAQELTWMEATAFPAMQCHDDEHKAVQKSVREVMERVSSGDFSVGRSLAQALIDWFPGHADYLDSALAQWMVRKEMGGVPVVLRRDLVFSEGPLPSRSPSR